MDISQDTAALGLIAMGCKDRLKQGQIAHAATSLATHLNSIDPIERTLTLSTLKDELETCIAAMQAAHADVVKLMDTGHVMIPESSTAH